MKLEAVNHNKIITYCQQILTLILDKQVLILPDSSNPQESRFSLSLEGSSYFAATDKSFLVSVVPFYNDFWLHFSLMFDVRPKLGNTKRYEYYLLGTSIKVFFGDQATDPNKLLMFRAEWDNKDDSDTTIPHPQPHWHIHNTLSDLSPEHIADFQIFLEIKQEESNGFLDQIAKEGSFGGTPKRASLSDFHFAMSAGWMFEKSFKHELTESNLKIWLKESIAHILGQIRYCTSKNAR